MGNTLHHGPVNIGPVNIGLVNIGPAKQALFLLLALLPQPSMAADLQQLQRELIRHGFRLEYRHPPGTKAYGRFSAASKTLMISPLVTDLGIARPVFLHEAVHAAQSCPSGRLTLLGIQRSIDPVVESRIRFILRNHYSQANAALEREAFLIQAQPDAEEVIITALRNRCQPPGG